MTRAARYECPNQGQSRFVSLREHAQTPLHELVVAQNRGPVSVCGRIGPSGCGAAWLARLLGVQEVPGSNPGSPTKLTLQNHHSFPSGSRTEGRLCQEICKKISTRSVADPYCHRTGCTFARPAMALLHLRPPRSPRLSPPSRSFRFFKLHRIVQRPAASSTAGGIQ